MLKQMKRCFVIIVKIKINNNTKNEDKRKENNAGKKANIKPYPKPNINVV